MRAAQSLETIPNQLPGVNIVKAFSDLTEREILAIAIASEEEDARIYIAFAEDLEERYPGSAKTFRDMAEVEKGHREMLMAQYQKRFGDELPPIRREDVKGTLKRRPIWLTRNLPLDRIRAEAEIMEHQAARYYEMAATQATDVGTRKLLGDLALAEQGHEKLAGKLQEANLSPDAREEEDRTRHRLFVLQYVQPGLAGLMDGSVSTLAPLFAAAFATHHNWETLLVGLAASIGAGSPWASQKPCRTTVRSPGAARPGCAAASAALMTTVGGLGHTLPYLVPDAWPNSFWIATGIAGVVVFFEFWAIAYVRAQYMDTPFLQAVFQIVLGGVIVLGGGHIHRRGMNLARAFRGASKEGRSQTCPSCSPICPTCISAPCRGRARAISRASG